MVLHSPADEPMTATHPHSVLKQINFRDISFDGIGCMHNALCLLLLSVLYSPNMGTDLSELVLEVTEPHYIGVFACI